VVAPSTGEAEPRPSSTVEAAVEATTAEASVHDAERADADVAMEEVPPMTGQEAAQAGEPQQDPPAEPTATVEGGATEPLPKAPEEEALTVEALAPEVSAVEGLALTEELAPVTVDLTLDDSPLDKGKQVVGVEGVRPRTRLVPRRWSERREPRARPVLPRGQEMPRPDHHPRGRISPRWLYHGRRRRYRGGGVHPSSSGTPRTPTPSPSLP
jgi:hypothetical protein